MSELRKDIISGRWVIIAAERSKRPDDFRPVVQTPAVEAKGFCPFCPGNETRTPPEVYAVRTRGSRRNGPGWLIRVVPNKFPALQRGGSPVQHNDGGGLFPWMEGVGVHEVVIEGPDHGKELPDLSLSHLEQLLETYRQRLKKIEAEFQYQYVHIFKNKGKEAGASLSHPHSQIVATPIIPKKINEEIKGSYQLYRQLGECVFCRLIEEERKRGERLILENKHFCVLMPFAPRFPFEMKIYPRRHSPWFSDLTRDEIKYLARALKTILSRLRHVLSDPPYNFYIHQGPNPHLTPSGENKGEINLTASFHWQFEIIPVLTRAAGFEWGTGFYINPVSPEDAANFMRKAGK